MKRQNGGYLIIDLSSTTLVADLVKAYANGKPVLVYENDKATWCVIKENEGAYTLVNPDTTYSISSEGVVTKDTTVRKVYAHSILISGDFTVSEKEYTLALETVIYNSENTTFTEIADVAKYLTSGNVGLLINATEEKSYFATISISGNTVTIFSIDNYVMGNISTSVSNLSVEDHLI